MSGYVDRIQSRGQEYINGLRGTEFSYGGDVYEFFFYEIHRVHWCITAGFDPIDVYTAQSEHRALSNDEARVWLSLAAGIMNERSAVFHEATR